MNFTQKDFANQYHYSLNPKTSSKNRKPIFNFGLTIIFILIAFCINFQKSVFVIVFIANIIFLLNFGFKLLLFFIFFKKHSKHQCKFIQHESFSLPIYTILLPCYMEEKIVLERLVKNIEDLEYPKEKLDVKFLLEEKDIKTFENLSQIKHNFEVIIVPYFLPKTKPKACNYGLYQAKGEFIVIYDAEDKPEKDQLLKALSVFKQNKEDVICVQAMLNFYNASFNALTKFFSIEYLIWFNVFLPSLSKLNMFLPLGGTSNHFKTAKLIEIGAWDSYNVTEDAELGVRIAKKGYKTKTLQSYTFEEAPIDIKTWLPQRTRWLKGFLQTFLAHIGDFKGNRKLGLLNFLNLFLMIGFSFFTFFLIPITIILKPSIVFNSYILLIFSINVISNIIYILIIYLIVKKNNIIANVTFFLPFYFILHIIASYIAFFELFIKPFYWHKTKHGVVK